MPKQSGTTSTFSLGACPAWTGIDTHLGTASGAIEATRSIPYDTLVIAVGAESNDFGTKGVQENCFFLDSRAQAEKLHKVILHHYLNAHAANERRPLSIAIVGGWCNRCAAVGILCKKNASISGAEVGCQGEVGSVCTMAAAGLAEVLGGTPSQVENAAEISLEHNLGLTCCPVGGLVQVPCIERNAMAAVKAALRGDGDHFISLDHAIRTMRDTGADMHDKYKETSRGGLAVNLVVC